MSRHHHTPPAGVRRARPDRRVESADDFWGDTAEWPTSEIPAVASVAPAERLLDDEVTTGGTDHGTYADLAAPLDDTLDDERWDNAWTPEPELRPSGIDPFVLRVGAVVVALTLAVPLFLGFRSDGDDASSIETASAVAAEAEPSPGAEAPVPTTVDGTESSTAGAVSETAAPAAETVDDGGPSICGSEYDVVEGDFWIRIADGAGVELADLLEVNDATVDSALFPGSSICLPAGASAPPPPETAAALTADDSSQSALSSGASASATAQPVPNPRTPPPTVPATTAAPTTTVAPAPAPVPPSDVVAVIRSVWPDELEERAITIAWRESNHRPDVFNGSCCYGLFQIYYDVHASWLASDLGITSASQLYDPVLNARAAYRLYERAGGWGPWAQTNY